MDPRIITAVESIAASLKTHFWPQSFGDVAQIVLFLLTLVTLFYLRRYTNETVALRVATRDQVTVNNKVLEETVKLRQATQDQASVSNELLKATQAQAKASTDLLAETQAQSAASIRPILQMVSSVRRTTLVTDEITYQVRNLGVGPAFNISIEAVRFPKAVYLFQNPDTLGTGESGDVLPVRSAEEQDRAKRVGWYDFFIEGDNHEPFNIVVRYQNAEGRAYFTHHVITFEDGPVTQLLESGPQV